MTEIIIRRAEKDDVRDIYDIEKLCFASPWSVDSLTYELEKNPMALYIAAEADGKTAGYAGLWKIGDEGHITNVAVRPEFRRMKIGEKIIGALIESASREGIAHFTLEVRKSNMPAIKLYEKFGFRTEGVRKKYYEDNGEDALIMWSHTAQAAEK